ncbi:unnamed protein product [Bursaphelenchus okinawaensis]|uniref:Ubiquitin-like protease family profile domain-containing protein n=1 Tax=Bursaphelenchus okinawaensis TaxID=465554 RepID=A0A811JTR0_9BILA|nr:unnamed protein product [Bursaphelenchus okinawaensis]CAG9083005.1 unnamed protein product [Bursaphelenchus okinawaensis]
MLNDSCNLNDSFDLHALEKYRNSVYSLNSNVYELPEETNDVNVDDGIHFDHKAGTESILGVVSAHSKILNEECEYLKGLLNKKRIERQLRDKKRELQYKKLRHKERCTTFDANVHKEALSVVINRHEGHFRWINRLNIQIDTERQFREALKLPKKLPLFLSIEENYFPELSEEALRLVETVWYGQNDNEVFCEGFGAKITRKDLKTLGGLNWLNDEIINFYMSLIMNRAEQDTSLPKTYVFNTFFYKTLSERGFAGVKRWTRKVDVFSYDVILIPVHMGNHWCMSMIDFTRQGIFYFDSLGGKNTTCLRLLGNYLMEEHMDKKKSSYDVSMWTFECPAVPMQLNGSDCGVFSSIFAEFSSRLCEFKFDQRVMPYYRQRMVYEIVNKKLLI